MIDAEVARRIAAGTHPDPFSVLGLHVLGGKPTIRAFFPGADRVEVLDAGTQRRVVELAASEDAEGVFTGTAARRKKVFDYLLRVTMGAHHWVAGDPYSFGPVLGDLDEHLISEGAHLNLWKVLGAHVMTHEGVKGTHFAVWAPNARRVSVVGGFNFWDGRRHQMRKRGTTGVWEIFLPGVLEGAPYKYEILGADGTVQPLKADPVGFGSEHAPSNASVVRDIAGYGWDGRRHVRTYYPLGEPPPPYLPEGSLDGWWQFLRAQNHLPRGS